MPAPIRLLVSTFHDAGMGQLKAITAEVPIVELDDKICEAVYERGKAEYDKKHAALAEANKPTASVAVNDQQHSAITKPKPIYIPFRKYEFDVCTPFPNEARTGVCEVQEQVDDDCNTRVVLSYNGNTHVVMESLRDQWGTYHIIGGITIASEDETRSFIDALIQCLTHLRSSIDKPSTNLMPDPTESVDTTQG